MKTTNLIRWCLETASEKRRTELENIITKTHPSIRRSSIGKSLCGRDIECFQIGKESDSVLYAGAFHGMEWITSLLLLRFLNNVAECYEKGTYLSEVDIKQFLLKRGLTIIPCVNPDGVEISLKGASSCCEYEDLITRVSGGNTERWQANARGVDLNHNFDAGFRRLQEIEQIHNITEASPTRFGGPYPHSEPESRSLVEYCLKRNFRHAVAFHSQGREIYWSYGKTKPYRSELMAQIMASSCGYKMSYPEKIATGGGFKDWFIDKYHHPAFTIEVGKGTNPLPITHLDKIYYELEEMMVLCSIM